MLELIVGLALLADAPDVAQDFFDRAQLAPGECIYVRGVAVDEDPSQCFTFNNCCGIAPADYCVETWVPWSKYVRTISCQHQHSPPQCKNQADCDDWSRRYWFHFEDCAGDDPIQHIFFCANPAVKLARCGTIDTCRTFDCDSKAVSCTCCVWFP